MHTFFQWKPIEPKKLDPELFADKSSDITVASNQKVKRVYLLFFRR